MRTPQQTYPVVISFLAIFLSTLLLSGCHRAKRAPSDETKKEASEIAPSPQKTEQPAKSPKPFPASPAENATAPKTPSTTQELGQDAIASGSTLLNPAVPKDAEMIQTRLVKLGLYEGPIDGIWGKGSRAGLKAFKEKNSLEDPEKWDKETQALLFGGADEAAKTSEEPDEESISSGEIILNPDKAKEARIIQKRLADLGLYKGPIDGIWGKGSRAALKVFRERNSMMGPDKWDKETQLLLFHK